MSKCQSSDSSCPWCPVWDIFPRGVPSKYNSHVVVLIVKTSTSWIYVIKGESSGTRCGARKSAKVCIFMAFVGCTWCRTPSLRRPICQDSQEERDGCEHISQGLDDLFQHQPECNSGNSMPPPSLLHYVVPRVSLLMLRKHFDTARPIQMMLLFSLKKGRHVSKFDVMKVVYPHPFYTFWFGYKQKTHL